MAFTLQTEHGFDFFEVSSAMQKAIRRGLEEEALYWAIELSYRTPDHVWKRLTIIASEDIGPADSLMAILIHDLYDHYRNIAKHSKTPAERIFLSHFVMALCRAPKSRVANDLYALVAHQLESEGLRREIPDYALDFHTRRGKQAGSNFDHWDRVGCHLEDEVEGLNINHDRVLPLRQRYGRLKPKEKRGRGNAGPEQLGLEEDGDGS